MMKDGGALTHVPHGHPELVSGSEVPNSQMLNQVQHDKKQIEEGNKSSASEKLADGQRGGAFEYILEPTPRELIRTLYPRVLAVRLFATLLDSSAAEHAARSFAMQQATDNGEMLLQELNLQYNKVRQQSITNELLDIVGGTMR